MPQGAPATIMRCRDGHVWMLALEVGQWRGLKAVMGNPEWADMELFDDMLARAQNADIIYPLIEEWTMQHNKMEIMEKCQAAVALSQRYSPLPKQRNNRIWLRVTILSTWSIPSWVRSKSWGAFNCLSVRADRRSPHPCWGNNAEVYRDILGFKQCRDRTFTVDGTVCRGEVHGKGAAIKRYSSSQLRLGLGRSVTGQTPGISRCGSV